MTVTLPQGRATLVDKDSRTAPEFYRWMAGVTDGVNAVPADTSASISAIATKLGSPDGTVANIPAQTDSAGAMFSGSGVSITGAGTVDQPWIASLSPVENSGVGALLGITRDGYGRVSGTIAVTTDDLTEGVTNLYFTDARARAAVVIDSIADADTTHAPSRNAVFDALALVQNKRAVSSVAVNTTAAAASGTDYVYFVSGTTTLTLPTAVGNTNRYTVKNTGAATVTVACTGAETINGSATLTLAGNVSADLISDGANWRSVGS